MGPTLDQATGASVPLPALPALASLRRVGEIRVLVAGDRAWVRWEAGDEAALRRVVPIAGAELYARRGDLWYRPGHHLPAFGLPFDDEGAWGPLWRALLPAPLDVAPPGGRAPRPARLGLARAEEPRAATALRCGLEELGRWADAATSAAMGGLRAAVADDRALVAGPRLPALPGAERFWGRLVLVPLGFRAEPDLPESALRGILGAAGGDVVVLDAEGSEVVPGDAFGPLTRAGVRLALEGRRS